MVLSGSRGPLSMATEMQPCGSAAARSDSRSSASRWSSALSSTSRQSSGETEQSRISSAADERAEQQHAREAAAPPATKRRWEGLGDDDELDFEVAKERCEVTLVALTSTSHPDLNWYEPYRRRAIGGGVCSWPLLD